MIRDMRRTILIWSLTESGFFAFFIMLGLQLDGIINIKSIYVTFPLLAQEALMIFVC
jgi:hypothetical protein